MFSRAICGLLSFTSRRGIVGNGLALQTELHGHRLWQGSNLRPSKEPSHITTGELIVQLIAGEWATRYRHFCPSRTEVARPEVTAIYHHRRMSYPVRDFPLDPSDRLYIHESRQILAGEQATTEH